MKSIYIEKPTEEIQTLLESIFKKYGASQMISEKMAKKLVENEIDGYPSHGIRRIFSYIEDIKNQRLRVNAVPSVKKVTESIIQIDGAYSFGVFVIECIVQEILNSSKKNAVSIISVNNAHHIGRLYDIGAQLAKAPHHLLVMGFCNYLGHGARVAEPNGKNQAILCTNPLLQAFPVKNNAPFVLDMSTSIISEGHIACAYESNQKLSDGFLLGNDGEFVRDPAELYLDPPTATIAPLGHPIVGHKGYGLGVFIEAMVGILGNAHHVGNPAIFGGNGLVIIGFNPPFFNQQHSAELGKKIVEHCYSMNGSSHYPGEKTKKHSKTIKISSLWHQKILGILS